VGAITNVEAGAMGVQELHRIIVMDPVVLRQTYLVQALNSLSGCQAQGLAPEAPECAEQLSMPQDSVVLVQDPAHDLLVLCEQIRQSDYTGPILVLTAETDVFLAEADEVLPLPVSISHLAGRIRAHTSLYQSHENAELVLGDYILKTGLRHLLLPNGQLSKLTEKEVRILRTLHRAQGQAVPRDELLSEIWGYDSRLTTHTLETHIYRLRQKSENAGEGPVLVLTEAGGYRLAV
jgi:DNA-binding response OmpR family regulator